MLMYWNYFLVNFVLEQSNPIVEYQTQISKNIDEQVFFYSNIYSARLFFFVVYVSMYDTPNAWK